jgi:hypothetical protein
MDYSGILKEAFEIVWGDRKDDYGTPSESLERVAKIWSVILHKEITPSQVTLCMIGLKLARASSGDAPTYDSMLDIAGYVEIWNHIC